MPRHRAKRLAVIEDNNQDNVSPQNALLQQIRATQHKLINGIFKEILKFPDGTPDKTLVETFLSLVSSEILDFSIDKTFESIQSVEANFVKLLTDFKNASKALGLAESHQSLCEGLELFIQWYHVQAIEAFLYKPLANEFVITHHTLEAKVSLQDRFNILIQKINYFNSQIEEIEQGLAYYQLPVMDAKETDLRAILQPLLAEESRLNILPNQAKIIEKLEQERLVLVKNLADLNHEMEQKIADSEEALKKAKENREKLYESTLGIDVYYVNGFKKKHKEVFEAYKKLIIRSNQRDEFLRIDAIEKCIQIFSEPFRIFESSLSAYSSHTSSYVYHKVSTYYSTINGIYGFLTQQFSTFQSHSAMLRLEKEYEQQYEYLRIERPQLAEEAEKNFVEAAKLYLREIATLDDTVKAEISSQTKEAFDYDVLNDALGIRPSNYIPIIKTLTSKTSKRDKLNKNWDEVFNRIFTNELQDIKSELDVLTKLSPSDLPLLKKMEGRLRAKREALDAILDNDHYPHICEMLEVMYFEVNLKHPVICEIRNHIKHLENSSLAIQEEHKLPPQNEHKLIPMSVISKPDVIPTPVPKSEPKIDSRSPWYVNLTNKTWKRAVIYGLLTFAAVMLAFTVWGLAAEVAAVAIIMPGIGFAGMGFSMVAGTYYISKKCCANTSPENTVENAPPMLPNVMPRQKQSANVPERSSDLLSTTYRKAPSLHNSGFRLFDHNSRICDSALEASLTSSKEQPSECLNLHGHKQLKS